MDYNDILMLILVQAKGITRFYNNCIDIFVSGRNLTQLLSILASHIANGIELGHVDYHCTTAGPYDRCSR